MIRRIGLQAVEMVIFGLLFAAILGQSVYLITYVREQREVVDAIRCQTELNTQFRIALKLRTDAATREREAQRELLTGPPARDPATARERVQNYLNVLDEADRERDANPLPQDSC